MTWVDKTDIKRLLCYLFGVIVSLLLTIASTAMYIRNIDMQNWREGQIRLLEEVSSIRSTLKEDSLHARNSRKEIKLEVMSKVDKLEDRLRRVEIATHP
jgi:hypothetical protein